MLTLSPQVGDLLLKVTHSQDLEEALHKVRGSTWILSSARSPLRLAVWRESGDVPLPSLGRRPKRSIPTRWRENFGSGSVWKRLSPITRPCGSDGAKSLAEEYYLLVSAKRDVP